MPKLLFRINYGISLLLSFSLFGKTFEPPSGKSCPPEPELAITAGMILTAETPKGVVTITAEDDSLRTFQWGKACRRTIRLNPRSSRWYGSCGIYSREPWISRFFTCEGLSRILAGDNIMDFESLEEAQEYLTNRDSFAVFRDDGLMVSYVTVPGRAQINVIINQILIKGVKPRNLIGSNNEKLRVTFKSPTSRFYTKVLYWLTYPLFLFGIIIACTYIFLKKMKDVLAIFRLKR